MSHREIVEAYPVLTVEDVNGVLEYAAKALQNDIVIDVKMASGV